MVASVGLVARPAAADVGGTGRIRNFGHGLCLDADINRIGSGLIPVKTYSCHGRANQTWVIEPIAGTGHKRIRNLIDPNRSLCLEPFGFQAPDKGPVRVAACTGSTAQQWDFVQASNQPVGLVSVRDVYGTTTLRGSGSSRQAQAHMRQIIADYPQTWEQWYVPVL